MPVSFRDVANLLDPTHPPNSIKLMADHIRWIERPKPLSLRMMLRRFVDPRRTEHRFLFYNTYLLAGFKIPWDDFILVYLSGGDPVNGLKEMLRVFGLDALDALTRLNYGPADLLRLLGVSPREIIRKYGPERVAKELGIPVPPFVGNLLAFIIGWYSGGAIGIILALELKVSDIIQLAGFSPVQALAKIGVRPTIILSLFGINLPDTIGGKDIRPERATEIGLALAGNYDIVALCEVFEQESRNRILDGWKKKKIIHPVYSKIGPHEDPNEYIVEDSGLFTVSCNRPIKKDFKSVPYSNRGNHWRDVDAWANKGVLLTPIDIGIGCIELYSTHLYAGGGIPYVTDFLGSPSSDERQIIKMKQVDELVSFIQNNHKSENIIIVVGDFNVNAHSDYYKGLTDRLKKLDLEDVWFEYGKQYLGKDSKGKSLFRQDSKGFTSTNGEIRRDPMEAICQLFLFNKRETIYYCDETKEPDIDFKPSRIDYIFIQRPNKNHAFNLDISRVYRRPFRRNTTSDKHAYMSDHLGLFTTLFASPRH